MMKATNTTRGLFLLAIVVGMTACSDTLGPEADPPPAPQPVRYNLAIETRYIEVEGSCDADILGNSTPGEFQYRIEIREGSQLRGQQESRGYNEITGENFQRNRTTTINFANRTYRWTDIARSADIKVTFRGAEWDGVRKDSRMANRGVTKDVPFRLGSSTHRVGLGPEPTKCALGLYYDATWTEVPG